MSFFTNDSRSFAGGVHPPEGKHLTEDRVIEPGPSAKELAILLSQHIGAPAQPLVKKGDVVQAGQKIGDCQAFIGARSMRPWRERSRTSPCSHTLFRDAAWR